MSRANGRGDHEAGVKVQAVFPPDHLLDGLDFLTFRLGTPALLNYLDAELRKLGTTLPRWVADTICGKLVDKEPAFEAFRNNVTVHTIVTMIDAPRRAHILARLGAIEREAAAYECGNVTNPDVSRKVRELREEVCASDFPDETRFDPRKVKA